MPARLYKFQNDAMEVPIAANKEKAAPRGKVTLHRFHLTQE
jgi:hypothetical protein